MKIGILGLVSISLLTAGCGNRAAPSSPTTIGKPEQPAAASANPGPGNGTQSNAGYLILVGSVSSVGESAHQANLSAVLWQERPNDPSSEIGPCWVELVDANQKVLAQSRFDPISSISISTNTQSKQESMAGPFTVSLPWASAAAALRVLCQGQTLLTVERSPNSPHVQATQPAENQTVQGVQKVTWDVSDADGDAVQVQVQVKNDDETWSALTSLTLMTEFDLDTPLLKDGLHHIRILATDGFNVAFATRAIVVRNQ